MDKSNKKMKADHRTQEKSLSKIINNQIQTPEFLASKKKTEKDYDEDYDKNFRIRVKADSLYLKGLSAYDKISKKFCFDAAARLGSPDAQCELGVTLLAEGDTISGVHYIRRAASRNYPKIAAMYMGDLYYFGIGSPKDDAKALEWYEKGAAAGDIFSTYYAFNLLIEKGDTVQAVKYLDMVHKLKDDITPLINKEQKNVARSLHFLGTCKFYGDYGETNDIPGALQCFADAESLGNGYATFVLGVLKAESDDYEYIRDFREEREECAGFIQRDDNESWRLFQKAAEAGDKYAQVLYGDTLFAAGDFKKAYIFYEKAYNNSNHDRTYDLCQIAFINQDWDKVICWGQKNECLDIPEIEYFVGLAYNCKDSIDESVTWLKKAVGHGNTESYYSLGLIAEEKSDSVAAFNYFSEGVEAGGFGCAARLADYYFYGEVVPTDFEKAKEFCFKALEEGDKDSGAYFILGAMSCSKQIIKKPDWKTATEYFRQGAEAGDPISQFCYGKCLEKGKGVKKDRQAAAHWMNVLQETDSEYGEYIINFDWKKELGISW